MMMMFVKITAKKLIVKIAVITLLLIALTATAVVWASDSNVQPQPALPSVDVMNRAIEIKNKIHALHQEIDKLHKELDSLYASMPKIPEPPIVVEPNPNQSQIEQLMRAIEKWNTILNDSAASETEKKRAYEEIVALKQSIAKLQDDGRTIGIYPPPPPPLPCLGAYLDASGQLRNACGENNVKPLPVPNDDVVVCMALHCPKPSPNQQQIDQLMKAIEKWYVLINDSKTAEAEKKRAYEEIANLKQSIAKLQDDGRAIGIFPPPPPKPPVKPPVAEKQVTTSSNGAKNELACMELNCPKPAPAKPAPVKPEPVRPQPVKPQPVKPQPVKPQPLKPTPVRPAPVKPTPVKPQPVKPQPVRPEPVKPAPVKPEPVKPQPIKPAPAKSQLSQPVIKR
jgi:hypothetical protein